MLLTHHQQTSAMFYLGKNCIELVNTIVGGKMLSYLGKNTKFPIPPLNYASSESLIPHIFIHSIVIK